MLPNTDAASKPPIVSSWNVATYSNVSLRLGTSPLEEMCDFFGNSQASNEDLLIT
jgi:hypothetical protein